MPRGGRRTGAGRKPGAVTAKTREAAVKALPDGITPLEVILRTMRHLWKDATAVDEKTGSASIIDDAKAKEAMAVAASAAPYCHARIAPKEESPPTADQGEEIDLQDAGRRMAFLLAAAEHKPQVPKALPKPKAKQPA